MKFYAMKLMRVAAWVLFAVLLAGCGGGGGSTSTPPLVIDGDNGNSGDGDGDGGNGGVDGDNGGNTNMPGEPPLIVLVDPPPVIPAMWTDPRTGLSVTLDLGDTDNYFADGGAWLGAGNGNVTDNNFALSNYYAYAAADEEPYHRQKILDYYIKGSNPNDPKLYLDQPWADVRAAWANGWTGKGVNILIVDDYRLGEMENGHGYKVTLSAKEIALRANYYAYQGPFDDTFRDDGVRDMATNVALTANERSAMSFGVVNWSFGEAFESDPLDPAFGFLRAVPGPLTSTQINSLRASSYFDDISTTGTYLSGASDAVITKAAGNEGRADANHFSLNAVLLADGDFHNRTLFVGWLDTADVGTTDIHMHSAVAGANTDMQNRFLVEYGGWGLTEGQESYACPSYDGCPSGVAPIGGGGTDLSGEMLARANGTSFAAPRVAGYAALLRQKFPTISGATTASILLETAGYEDLACDATNGGSGCAADTYGRGRVNLGRALSPLGELE